MSVGGWVEDGSNSRQASRRDGGRHCATERMERGDVLGRGQGPARGSPAQCSPAHSLGPALTAVSTDLIRPSSEAGRSPTL